MYSAVVVPPRRKSIADIATALSFVFIVKRLIYVNNDASMNEITSGQAQ